MLSRRTSLAAALAASLSAALPACLLNSTAFDGAPGPTGGAAGSTTTGMGASTTSTTGTAGGGGDGASGGTATTGGGGAGGGGTGGTGGAIGGTGGGGGVLVAGDKCPGTDTGVAVYTEVLVDGGDTTGAKDDYGSGVCGGGSAPDVVYAVTALAKGRLTVTLEPGVGDDGKTFAGFVQLRSTCKDAGTELGCGPEVTVPVDKDSVTYVIVDGHANDPNGPAQGPFKLHLYLDGCGNGTIDGPEQCDDGNTLGNDTCDATCMVRCTAEGSITTNSKLFVHPASHHCYLLSFDPNSNWQQAFNDCQAWGGTLAALATQQEIGDVADLIGSAGEDIWIGGDDTAVDGTFVWVDGEPWSYTNGSPPWQDHPGFTNEPNGGNVENCVEIYSSGRLNDEHCENSENWLCERPPAGEAPAN